MDFKFGFSAVIVMCLFSGCGRADLSSKAEFDDASEPQKIIAELIPKLVRQVERLDGACSAFERGMSCRFLDRNTPDSTDIQIGVSNGKATIVVHAESTFLLPKSDKSMMQGNFVPSFHKQWEAWITHEAKKIGPHTRTRYYTGLGVIGGF